MCGICGFIDIDNFPSLAESQEVLRDMCREMEHRGPDDRGYYLSGTGIGLGAVRLSIIDLEGGHQPISNEDGSLWVVLNGEIYNYYALRKQLIGQGHTFSTRCDTEVVVHAYEQWGEDCVRYLNGMFAFAIWDERCGCLFLARDRLGKKPLYYTYERSVFVFASEIKSLLRHPASESIVDLEAVDLFMSFSYIPGPKTIYRGVKKLPPGSVLRIDRNGKIVQQVYWDVPEYRNGSFSVRNEQTAIGELRHQLEESVKARLLADVPVGVFLSGGLDSSLVTAMMMRHKSGQLKSFSVRFSENEHNEAFFAQEVAEFLGTEHYELTADHCSPDLLRKLIWHCDEPLADPAIVPTYLVSQLAREQVTVVLTGEGADELFAGYFYYPLERKAASYDWMPNWAKQRVLVNGARGINSIIGRQRYHPRTIWSWQLRPEERMLAWMSVFTDEEKERWLTPSAKMRTLSYPTYHHLDGFKRHHAISDWFSQFAYIDLKVPLVDDLLMKVDKMSMAASLEARCPFLDYRLVEYAYMLPPTFKLAINQNKVILRKVAADLLPNSIINRQKHGFDVPLKRWLTEDLSTYFWDLIVSRGFEDLQIINRPQVEEIWSEMEADVPTRARQIWSLLILAIWMDLISS